MHKIIIMRVIALGAFAALCLCVAQDDAFCGRAQHRQFRRRLQR